MSFPHPPGYFSLHPDRLAQLSIDSNHALMIKEIIKSAKSHARGGGLKPSTSPVEAFGGWGAASALDPLAVYIPQYFPIRLQWILIIHRNIDHLL